ncbi:CD1107 family mobile element protein, partial [Clostridium butyricum]|uniref:CD1107 family mobile element protein n=1 Tax=Clostridium butyricum TaxID=1492 RepID=UPI003466CFAD
SVCSTDRVSCTGKAPELTEPAEPQPEKGKGNPMGIVALLVAFGLIGVGAFYYFKVVKNKAKPQSNPNMNEYDYSDDDEDEDEYEPTAEEQEDTPEESEDDTQ